MIKSFKKIVKSPLKYIYVVVILLLGANWIIFRDVTTLTEGLASGLLTEIIGAIVILILIEKALERDAIKKELPRIKAYHKEINALLRRVNGFFSPSALDSHKQALEGIEIYSIERLHYIETHIDLWGSSRTSYNIFNSADPKSLYEIVANMPPVIEWYRVEMRNIKILGDKVLDRYCAYLPPELFGHVYTVTNSGAWEALHFQLHTLEYNKNVAKQRKETTYSEPHEKRFLTNANPHWHDLLESAKHIAQWISENEDLGA